MKSRGENSVRLLDSIGLLDIILLPNKPRLLDRDRLLVAGWLAGLLFPLPPAPQTVPPPPRQLGDSHLGDNWGIVVG